VDAVARVPIARINGAWISVIAVLGRESAVLSCEIACVFCAVCSVITGAGVKAAFGGITQVEGTWVAIRAYRCDVFAFISNFIAYVNGACVFVVAECLVGAAKRWLATVDGTTIFIITDDVLIDTKARLIIAGFGCAFVVVIAIDLDFNATSVGLARINSTCISIVADNRIVHTASCGITGIRSAKISVVTVFCWVVAVGC